VSPTTATARAEAKVLANALLEAEPLDREALRRELARFEWGAYL
jgi:ABC-type branched-subunit amino acid transport system substrate-binding protein